MTRFTLRGIAGGLATVLVVLVLAAFVVQAVPAVVGADASYVVLSGSMAPTISEGDAVIVNNVDPANVERGDVITYTRGEDSTPITHRVVEIVEREDGLAFRTKGDANDAADRAPVPADNVTGEVWFAIPLAGHVVMFANTTTGLATLIGLPIGAFVLSELYTFVRDRTTGESDTAAASDDGTDVAAADQPADVVESGGATGAAPTVDDSEDADGTVTVTAMDLKFSSVGFLALMVYSGYMAYLQMSPARVAVFTAAALVVVFLATVLLFGRADSENANQPVDDASGDGMGGAATDGGHTADSTAGGEDDDD